MDRNHPAHPPCRQHVCVGIAVGEGHERRVHRCVGLQVDVDEEEASEEVEEATQSEIDRLEALEEERAATEEAALEDERKMKSLH